MSDRIALRCVGRDEQNQELFEPAENLALFEGASLLVPVMKDGEVVAYDRYAPGEPLPQFELPTVIIDDIVIADPQ